MLTICSSRYGVPITNSNARTRLGSAPPDSWGCLAETAETVDLEGLYPGLTTVALPHYEMGAWAVDTLVAFMQGEPQLLVDRPVLLSCSLVIRDSVTSPLR